MAMLDLSLGFFIDYYGSAAFSHNIRGNANPMTKNRLCVHTLQFDKIVSKFDKIVLPFFMENNYLCSVIKT